MKTILGQPSWRIATKDVEAYITQLGGHLAPVTFDRTGKKFRPYSVAPWAKEKVELALPSMLKVLRGDFFCLPFGGNTEPYRGEKHPPHGETANGKWKLESLTDNHLHLSLNTRVRRGRVDKHIRLREGHNAIYSQHVISRMSGPISFGHHATLKFPETPGSGVISTSKFVYGQVLPVPFANPAAGSYQSLKPGATFNSLNKVAMINGELADLSRYPARRGFEDLALVVSDPKLPFAWTAVTFAKEGCVWFALKDPRVLRETIFWITNGGLYSAPWNGRHTGVMGLEEVTSYFHVGLAASARKNSLTAKGFPTCVKLNPQQPQVVNYIMATANIPKGFDRVASITAAKDNASVTLRSESGKSVMTPLDIDFLGSVIRA